MKKIYTSYKILESKLYIKIESDENFLLKEGNKVFGECIKVDGILETRFSARGDKFIFSGETLQEVVDTIAIFLRADSLRKKCQKDISRLEGVMESISSESLLLKARYPKLETDLAIEQERRHLFRKIETLNYLLKEYGSRVRKT